MTILHSSTRTLIDTLLSDIPQSLLLSGQHGVGLSEIAHLIAGAELANILTPDESTASRIISVERIRQLLSETKTKSPSRYIVIINEADKMTSAAQVAFLKLLEEPNPTTHFILLSSRPSQLLPTIRSRVQHHVITPITKDQSLEYILSLGVTDAKKQAQLLFLATGLPIELEHLATDDEYFSHSVEKIQDARGLLQLPVYEKLLLIHKYKDDRVRAVELVRSAIAIARQSLHSNPDSRLIERIDQLLSIEDALGRNQSVRLQLMKFVI